MGCSLLSQPIEPGLLGVILFLKLQFYQDTFCQAGGGCLFAPLIFVRNGKLHLGHGGTSVVDISVYSRAAGIDQFFESLLMRREAVGGELNGYRPGLCFS